MPVSTIAITGSVLDASGAGVEDAVVRLSPEPGSLYEAQARAGKGVMTTPVEVITGPSGSFSINAIQGFRYRLVIPAIGFDRPFEAPVGTTIVFTLLGQVPDIQDTAWAVDADGLTKIRVTAKVDDEATVRERYAKLKIERSTTAAFTLPSTFVNEILAPGALFYTHWDTQVDAEFYYRARYENTDGSEYSAWSDWVLASSAVTEELVVTVQELKDIYMFGVNLTDDDGTPYSDRMFQHFIKAATALVEKELDIPITPIEIDETSDHYAQDYARWGYFQLDRYPVIAVREVAFQYPSMTSRVVIDSKWLVLEDEGTSGVLQIVPGQGNIADVLIIPGQLLPLWSGSQGRVPGVWRIKYRAGFEVGKIPADVKHLIAMIASFGPFNVAGDLIGGAGIANKSVSLAGLSSSIGTTSSPSFSGYGARILQYRKEIEAMLPTLKRFYGKGSRMVVA